MRFAENMQHDTSKVLRLPRKIASELSKVLRLPRKMQRIFWQCSKSSVPATQNDFWHVLKHVTKCHVCHAKRHYNLLWNIRQGKVFRDETCWSIKTSILCETVSNFTLRSVKIDVFLRVFLWTYRKIDILCEASVDFHHLSQNATLATEFAPCQNTQRDTSKVLRLPRQMKWINMTSEVSKVLRLPRKMQRIFWQCSKSSVPATPSDFWHVLKHVGMSRSTKPATRNEATRRDAGKLQKWPLLQDFL